MVQWSDIIFGGDGETRCVLTSERDDMLLKVLEHRAPETATELAYLIELRAFSELSGEWQPVALIGDFDLHTAISLLAEAASELYRLRGIGWPPGKN